MGGGWEGIGGYTYLNNPIWLWPGDWEENFIMMNETVFEINIFLIEIRVECSGAEVFEEIVWKYIGWILLTVIYGKGQCMI